MKSLDQNVSLFFFQLRTDKVSLAMYYFTQLGSVGGVAAVTALAALLLVIRNKWVYLIALFTSVGGCGLSIYFTKQYFHRERPMEVAYYTVKTFSFPSGHSAGALALYGMVCYFIFLGNRKNKAKFFWLLLGVSYIVLIGLSRIYLGVHFLSDVVAGYLLASLWLLLSICVMEYLVVIRAERSLK